MKQLTPQEQFTFACNLARNNPDDRIAFVCPPELYPELTLEIYDCVYKSTSREVLFNNGAFLKLIDPRHLDSSPAQFSGYQITQIFYAKGVIVNYMSRGMLESRQRSTKYKGPLKTYYANGYATWKEFETYGE